MLGGDFLLERQIVGEHLAAVRVDLFIKEIDCGEHFCCSEVVRFLPYVVRMKASLGFFRFGFDSCCMWLEVSCKKLKKS